jgi:hypothetical protein
MLRNRPAGFSILLKPKIHCRSQEFAGQSCLSQINLLTTSCHSSLTRFDIILSTRGACRSDIPTKTYIKTQPLYSYEEVHEAWMSNSLTSPFLSTVTVLPPPPPRRSLYPLKSPLIPSFSPPFLRIHFNITSSILFLAPILFQAHVLSAPSLHPSSLRAHHHHPSPWGVSVYFLKAWSRYIRSQHNKNNWKAQLPEACVTPVWFMLL